MGLGYEFKIEIVLKIKKIRKVKKIAKIKCGFI